MAELPDSSRAERTELLGREMEELVVEAKRLGIGLEAMQESFSAHWKRLSAGERAAGNAKQDGGRKN